MLGASRHSLLNHCLFVVFCRRSFGFILFGPKDALEFDINKFSILFTASFKLWMCTFCSVPKTSRKEIIFEISSLFIFSINRSRLLLSHNLTYGIVPI